jgi:hypothetical protein
MPGCASTVRPNLTQHKASLSLCVTGPIGQGCIIQGTHSPRETKPGVTKSQRDHPGTHCSVIQHPVADLDNHLNAVQGQDTSVRDAISMGLNILGPLVRGTQCPWDGPLRFFVFRLKTHFIRRHIVMASNKPHFKIRFYPEKI